MIRGFVGNVRRETKDEFIKEVFQWVGLTIPDSAEPWNLAYDEKHDQPMTYADEIDEQLTLSDLEDELPLIKTVTVQSSIHDLSCFIKEKSEPLLIAGPSGSGKWTLIKHCAYLLENLMVTTIHCTPQTAPIHIIQRLSESCVVTNNAYGRVYHPREGQQLLLFVKDVNFSKVDKWGSSQLIAFFHQIISHGGFVDDDLEWASLENIRLVFSVNTDLKDARCLVPIRFTSLLRICSISYPTKAELENTYTRILMPIVCNLFNASGGRAVEMTASKLARSMIEIYDKVCCRQLLA
ncbi:unnamed protein product [Soboliphyme baturini]|uniref:Dynein heavy chain 7, axonemal n=1 Tax=Soboliphyme baturini TaxID=241478 RepID=A0A183J825_9BILA|nr:unnamed protein product [Soboliphyme baturini]